MAKEEKKAPLAPEEETLMLVRKLWRAEKWRRFWTIVKYAAYLGILAGAFYFLTPYVQRLIDAVESLSGGQIPPELQNILEQLK